MEISQCIFFHSFYKYTQLFLWTTPQTRLGCSLNLSGDDYLCGEGKKLEKTKRRKSIGWNFIRSLPRWERSGLKLCPGAGTLSHITQQEFRHLFGSWALPDFAAELHLQKSGIAKIFFLFLTEWPSASSSKGSHISPALDIFPFMTQLTPSYGELDSLIKAVGGRNVFLCSSYTFKGINI